MYMYISIYYLVGSAKEELDIHERDSQVGKDSQIDRGS